MGTTIGGNKITDYYTKANAMREFEEVYLDKTGNDWAYRANFQKHPNKFYPLDVVYDTVSYIHTITLLAISFGFDVFDLLLKFGP